MPVFGPSRPRLNPWNGFQVEIGTVTSRFLCSPETALSRRKSKQLQQFRPRAGADYSRTLVMEMIDRDAALGFDIPIPEGANFVEVSMPRDLMHFYKRVRQAHPNAVNLPPMVVVERGTVAHTIALLQGGVIFVKEDPQQS